MATAVFSAVFSAVARGVAKRTDTFGKPNAPISTYGGPAMLAALFCASFLFSVKSPTGLIEVATALFWVGFIDDSRPLSPKVKLGLTLLCVGAAVACGIRLDVTEYVWVDALLTMGWMVWLCHSLNVFDMEDGLSAGGALIAALGLWGIGGGDWLLFMVGVLLGFLIHSVYPARLYMGDAGALMFGFLLSVAAVSLSNDQGVSGGVGAFIIVGLPTFEAAFISVMRFAKGRSISVASHDHVAHRLEQWGRSVPLAVGMIWTVGIVLAGLGYAVAMGVIVWWLGLLIGLLGALIISACLARVDMEGDGVDGRLAGLLEKNWLIHRLMRQTMVDVVGYANGQLLDVGCGNRPYEKIFESQVSHSFGLEHDRNRYANANVWGDALALPFRADAFDTILSNQVLEHVPEPQQALVEVARVMRVDAHLILTAPHIWELHEVPHDYFRYTPYGLRHLAEKAGLEVLEIKALAGFWVTAGARFCYYLARFERGILKPLIRVLFLMVQLGALLLDRIHRVESDAWNFLMIARKKR
ncbi:MAG: methyltransferase domain-containing protein [Candidatus Latescibacteria bacterium]|nr:methyltransferase domain-containing protein [Candidatus Latescibacterota bacterium]